MDVFVYEWKVRDITIRNRVQHSFKGPNTMPRATAREIVAQFTFILSSKTWYNIAREKHLKDVTRFFGIVVSTSVIQEVLGSIPGYTL